MRTRRLAPALVLGAVLLAGCGSSSPADELRSKVAAVTDAANGLDADRLSAAVDDLLATAKGQRDTRALSQADYDLLSQYARQVKADAALLRSAPAGQPAPTSTAPAASSQPPTPSQAPPSGDGDGAGKGKGGKDGKDGKGGGHNDSSAGPSLPAVLPTVAATPTPAPTATASP